jgi:hypothetical protein
MKKKETLSIDDLGSLFKESASLVVLSPSTEIETLQKENKELREQLYILQKNIGSQSNALSPVSSEELVCIQQISILHSKSAMRELSLEEVKKLDLLIKNVRLIRQQATEVIETQNLSNLSEEDLVRIATTSEENS